VVLDASVRIGIVVEHEEAVAVAGLEAANGFGMFGRGDVSA
jgi:hypothetical protein